MSPAVAWLLLAPLLTPAPGQNQDRPVFGAGIELVEVDVAVSRGGQPVLGLTADEFVVRDNGVVQDVELVGTGEMPINVVLVLDTSGSVAGDKLAKLRAAAKALLDGLQPDDRAALVTFSQTVRVRSPLSEDLDFVRARLDQTVAMGMSAMNDALYAGLSMVQDRKERSVVVLFSDGADNISWLSDDKIMGVARESDPVVYAVAMIPGGSLTENWVAAPPSLMRRARVEKLPDPRVLVLERLADATGGRLLPTTPSELTAAFLEVLGEMRTRYLLRYVPTGVSSEGWHRLDVEVARRADVRARHGYLR